jgi:hypothetical protein
MLSGDAECVAAATNGVILAGVVALIATGDASRDDTANLRASTRSHDTASGFQPNRLSQLLSNPSEGTDGYNKAPDRTAPANAARPAIVPIPEVNVLSESVRAVTGGPLPQASTAPQAQDSETLVDNGWDFTNPDSIPGFGSMPEPADTPDARQQAARTTR